MPFKYEFLDDHFEELYRADAQVSTVMGVLAILANPVKSLKSE